MGQNAEKIIFMARNTHKYVAKEGSRNLICRRAPHGARGLKLCRKCHRRSRHRSRPARGAWIETEKLGERIVKSSATFPYRMLFRLGLKKLLPCLKIG